MPEKIIGNKNVVSAGDYELYSNLMGDINPKQLNGVKEINKEGLKNSYLGGRTSQFINRLGDIVKYVNLSGEVGKRFSFRLPELPIGYKFLVADENTYIIDDSGNFIVVPE